MTTATLATGNQTTDTKMARHRRSLEELVDRLIDALFKEDSEVVNEGGTHSIHEARRLRQARDIDGGLALLAAWTWRRRRQGRSGGPSPSGGAW